MKTSILISSFAALCLLVTFAEAPRRHGEIKMIAAPTENITFTTTNSVTMLSGPVITAERKNTSAIAVTAVAADDFGYLKFDVNTYMEADAANPEEVEMLPEAIETDFSYLKFNLGDYITDSGANGDEITELPESEISPVTSSANVPPAHEFDYLRFDVTNYINESEGIGELPAEEILPLDNERIMSSLNALKFNVANYYHPENEVYGAQFELPEKETGK
jgi:hypothetical protein